MNSDSTANSSASNSASADAISRRAYEIWENEGRPEGNDLRHWLQAEQELGISTSTPATRAPGVSSNGNSSSRVTESAPRHTDRPLQSGRNAGSSAKENKRATSTAPFERVPSSGGAQPAGAKRR